MSLIEVNNVKVEILSGIWKDSRRLVRLTISKPLMVQPIVIASSIFSSTSFEYYDRGQRESRSGGRRESTYHVQLLKTKQKETSLVSDGLFAGIFMPVRPINIGDITNQFQLSSGIRVGANELGNHITLKIKEYNSKYRLWQQYKNIQATVYHFSTCIVKPLNKSYKKEEDLNGIIETDIVFLSKSMIFIVSTILEDGVQTIFQYFYFEKFFVSFDIFVFINSLILVITSLIFAKGKVQTMHNALNLKLLLIC